MDIPVLDKDLEREQFAIDSLALFKLFSRFEYAMKRSDFIKQGSFDSAEPDWKAFATALGPDFFARVNGNEKMRILIDKPPSQLKFKPAAPPEPPNAEWTSRTYAQDTEGLIESLKQVRNNLFHGDKGSPPDVGRDSKLMGAAYAVLMEVLVWIEDAEIRKQRFASFVDKVTMPLMF
ncbi:hypothetical protein [Mesorhizobium sp. M0088]|uniref:hypothetical protein n=1 Tax=Mesorhizobium sp. M0088 TaxID=2956873 RepID=UPI00333BFEF4